jgi:hypothetical protein
MRKLLFKTLFFGLLFWSSNANAQVSDSLLTTQMARSYKQAIGIRSYVTGGPDRTLNFTQYLTSKTALEFNIGTIKSIKDVYQANAIYSFNNSVFNSKGLKYKLGAGLCVMYSSSKSYLSGLDYSIKKEGKVFPGIVGLAGLNYQFKNSRLILGADVRLHIYRFQNTNMQIVNPGLSLKYILKKD